MLDILRWAALVIAGFSIICTILPMFPTSIWWIRDMGFPRIQLSVLLLSSAVTLFIFARDDKVKLGIGIVALLCCIWQIYQIFPYTTIASVETRMAEMAEGDRRVKIMVANVLMSNRSVERLLEIVSETDPDILLAVETDQWWVGEIGGALREKYPYQVRQPQDNTYGMILCSRLELIDPQTRFLVENDIPSIIADVRLHSNKIISIYALHPRPPIPGNNTEERDAELLIAAKMVKKNDKPSIVFGDLNDVAWSQTTSMFQKISGALDPRKGRGTFSTFHADYFMLRYPLDHIFHTPEFRLVSIERLPSFGSDHFPISAEFSYEPEGRGEHKIPEADVEEVEEAEETIDEGLEK